MRPLIPLLSLFFCLGCQEYTSFYPIGEPSERTVKSPYIGNWDFVSGINLDSAQSIGFGDHHLRIVPFNEQEFLIQLVADTIESLRDIDHFRGYITFVGEQGFANISPLDQPEKRPVFSIYKYQLRGDTLSFTGIQDKKFKTIAPLINSVKEHKKFVQQYLNEESVWNMSYLYVRERESD